MQRTTLGYSETHCFVPNVHTFTTKNACLVSSEGSEFLASEKKRRMASQFLEKVAAKFFIRSLKFSSLLIDFSTAVYVGGVQCSRT